MEIFKIIYLCTHDSILECNKEIWAGSFIIQVLYQDFLEIQDIYNILFSQSVARVKKYLENIEKIQDKACEYEDSQPNFFIAN